MPKNKMVDVRNHMIETIEMLKSGDIDTNTARAINQLGSTVVESAKVEADLIKTIAEATGEIPKSEFMQTESEMKLISNGSN